METRFEEGSPKRSFNTVLGTILSFYNRPDISKITWDYFHLCISKKITKASNKQTKSSVFIFLSFMMEPDLEIVVVNIPMKIHYTDLLSFPIFRSHSLQILVKAFAEAPMSIKKQKLRCWTL